MLSFPLRRFIVFNRIPIAAVLLALGLLLGFEVTWWIAWIPMLIAIVMVIAHFMIGPMTLLQVYIEAGDMEGAQKMLARVKEAGVGCTSRCAQPITCSADSFPRPATISNRLKQISSGACCRYDRKGR
jgi:hypothetical protein